MRAYRRKHYKYKSVYAYAYVNSIVYLEKSQGIGAEELFDLRVLREDLTAAGSMRFVRVRPEEVRRHDSFSLIFPTHFSLSLSPLCFEILLYSPLFPRNLNDRPY